MAFGAGRLPRSSATRLKPFDEWANFSIRLHETLTVVLVVDGSIPADPTLECRRLAAALTGSPPQVSLPSVARIGFLIEPARFCRCSPAIVIDLARGVLPLGLIPFTRGLQRRWSHREVMPLDAAAIKEDHESDFDCRRKTGIEHSHHCVFGPLDAIILSHAV